MIVTPPQRQIEPNALFCCEEWNILAAQQEAGPIALRDKGWQQGCDQRTQSWAMRSQSVAGMLPASICGRGERDGRQITVLAQRPLLARCARKET